MRIPQIAVPHFKTKLPSNDKEITYRPYLVKEEKVLLMALQSAASGSAKPSEIADAIRHLIKACVVEPEDLNVDKLPSFDLEWIFLKIRAKSVGEVVEPRLKIPPEECGKNLEKCTLDIEVDLEKLQVVRNSEHNNKIMLNNEVGVVLGYPTGDMAAAMTNDPQAVEAVLNVIAMCVETVFDKDEVYTKQSYANPDEWDNDVRNLINNLTRDNMEKIKQFFSTMPKIQYHVETVCPKCGKLIVRDLEGVMDFFI